jgi:hypothetical protein
MGADFVGKVFPFDGRNHAAFDSGAETMLAGRFQCPTLSISDGPRDEFVARKTNSV